MDNLSDVATFTIEERPKEINKSKKLRKKTKLTE